MTTGSHQHDRQTPGFDELLAVLRRKTRGTDIKLAVHQSLPALRLSAVAGNIRIRFVADAAVAILIEKSSQMKMAEKVPSAKDDVRPWARALATFLVRRLRE